MRKILILLFCLALGVLWVSAEEPRSIPCLIARLRTINHTIDDEEILIAINLWIAQSRHPELPQPISDNMMIKIIDLWVRGGDCRESVNG
ncbi:MAG: hypothetical protein NZ610_05690 [Candidatus Bipolaricaulota bacterium]|nr:hypothetical protein [Candidatus Bipolaricaulota bacterium]MCS7274873.1 hypothetical protein [Candidatus Bipolaricaulota bacterium]MDW8111152.1 hypothetical protein [Candidatus Bipolaricaulota bacterium]MDW8329588.1 hypothetical protein [Candidatus Bipolaricaulota bacterium]